MSLTSFMTEGVSAAATRAVTEFVTLRHISETSFVSLPMAYPGGSFVTVAVYRSRQGFMVSDHGFAYREAEALGAQRAFAKTAAAAAEAGNVFVGKKSIFVDTTEPDLGRAIMDVAKASWTVADKIVERASEEAAAELEEHLSARLISLFGEAHVRSDTEAIGASTNPWEVSAIVELDGRRAIFQAVANHANSVYRTSTAFRDIGALDSPPKLISVVQSKTAFGPRLALLTQAGSVIEQGQSDQVFLRAAA
jgi:hypothetical protein